MEQFIINFGDPIFDGSPFDADNWSMHFLYELAHKSAQSRPILWEIVVHGVRGTN